MKSRIYFGLLWGAALAVLGYQLQDIFDGRIETGGIDRIFLFGTLHMSLWFLFSQRRISFAWFILTGALALACEPEYARFVRGIWPNYTHAWITVFGLLGSGLANLALYFWRRRLLSVFAGAQPLWPGFCLTGCISCLCRFRWIISRVSCSGRSSPPRTLPSREGIFVFPSSTYWSAPRVSMPSRMKTCALT